jgi:hypothetical protein
MFIYAAPTKNSSPFWSQPDLETTLFSLMDASPGPGCQNPPDDFQTGARVRFSPLTLGFPRGSYFHHA